jgi:hypothetical protein
MKITRKFLSAIFLILLLSAVVSAEDKLKPIVDAFFNAIKAVVDAIAGFIFGVFPGLENSIKNLFSADLLWPISDWAPWVRGLYWLFYLAAFFAVMAVIAKLWSLSKRYIVNSVVGVLLLLILIHIFGVGVKITLLKLIITAIFGIPGVIFILFLHYLGVSL